MFKEKDLVKYHENIHIILHIFKSGALRIYNINDSTERTLDSHSIDKVEKLSDEQLSMLPERVIQIRDELSNVYQHMLRTNYEEKYVGQYVELSKEITSFSPIYTLYTLTQEINTKNIRVILEGYRMKSIIYFLKNKIDYKSLNVSAKIYFYLLKMNLISKERFINYLEKKSYIEPHYFKECQSYMEYVYETENYLSVVEELEIKKVNNQLELVNNISFSFNPTKKKRFLNHYLNHINVYLNQRSLKKYLKY